MMSPKYLPVKVHLVLHFFQILSTNQVNIGFILLENNVNHNESKYLWLHELILLCEQYFLSTVKKTGKMLKNYIRY